MIRSLPFQYIGLDYFGPLYTKQTDENHAYSRKVWLYLFTCVAVRTIHLEVVADLSAEKIFLVLRRFFFQTPKAITSSSVDVVRENAIRDLDVQPHNVEKRIKWSFIVKLSPWMGGFYGRLVGINKKTLRKAIKKACLTMLQL